MMNALLICSALMSQNAPPPQCVCNPGPETFALIGLPVVLQTKGLPALTGTVLIAWPLEAHQIAMGGINPQTGRPMAVLDRPRSLYVLVEFDTGGIEWWNITELRIDVEKRKRQREMMFPPIPAPPQGYGQGQQVAPQQQQQIQQQQQALPQRPPPTVSEHREPRVPASYYFPSR